MSFLTLNPLLAAKFDEVYSNARYLREFSFQRIGKRKTSQFETMFIDRFNLVFRVLSLESSTNLKESGLSKSKNF